jgi:hypothetical protein
MQRISVAHFVAITICIWVASCAAGPHAFGRLAMDFSSLLAVPPPLYDNAWLQERLVGRCHQAIVRAARPYGLVQLETWGAGTARIRRQQAVSPVFVEAVYWRRGGPESRSALIRCQVNQRGRVVSLVQGSLRAPEAPSLPLFSGGAGEVFPSSMGRTSGAKIPP